MSEFKLNLRKFDMSKLRSDSVIVMIAKRNSGKSVLCKDILYHHRKIPCGMVISPTEKANKYYGDFIPDSFVYDDYDARTLEKLIQRQEILINDPTKKNIKDKRAFIVLDDCMFDNKWIKDTVIRNIFMNGRHYKLMFILTMQFALGIPPNLRTNIDYVFILRDNVTSNRKRLYDHYAGMFPTFEMFCTVMDKCTQNYECIVIDNSTRSNNIEEQVFWYKADIHTEYKMGHPSFWKHHKKKYNKNYNKISGDDGEKISRKTNIKVTKI